MLKRNKIYLDVCILCRPFDDQNMVRIRLETNCYFLIMQAIKNELYELVVSPVHFVEILAIKNIVERTELLFILKKYGKDTRANKIKALQRGEELYASGFGVADAAHLAYAETAAGSFVTCDDKLVKKSKMVNVGVDVVTPQEFCIREKLR